MSEKWAEEKAREWLDSDDHVLPWADMITESIIAAAKHDQAPPLDILRPSTEPRQLASLAALLVKVRDGTFDRILDDLETAYRAVWDKARDEERERVLRIVRDVEKQQTTGCNNDWNGGASTACDEIKRRVEE